FKIGVIPSHFTATPAKENFNLIASVAFFVAISATAAAATPSKRPHFLSILNKFCAKYINFLHIGTFSQKKYFFHSRNEQKKLFCAMAQNPKKSRFKPGFCA